MQIRYGYRIEVTCNVPTPFIAMLDVHPQQRGHILAPDTMTVTNLTDGSPVGGISQYEDQFGNICKRFVAPAGWSRIEAEGVIRDSGLHDAQKPGARALPPQELPDDVLVYLLGSRYCETDRLAGFAWSMFGGITDGWQKVQAVCDHVHQRIHFNYGLARNTRTAAEAFEEGVGVCRDFAHLAVTLCRCLNIPARYCTGYLGDIGVPLDPNPMDFSAWFEAYLDGQWWTFDARHNTPRIGRVVMARGRDATDVAILNSFGAHQLARFEVITEEVVPSLAARKAQLQQEFSSQQHSQSSFEHAGPVPAERRYG